MVLVLGDDLLMVTGSRCLVLLDGSGLHPPTRVDARQALPRAAAGSAAGAPLAGALALVLVTTGAHARAPARGAAPLPGTGATSAEAAVAVVVAGATAVAVVAPPAVVRPGGRETGRCAPVLTLHACRAPHPQCSVFTPHSGGSLPSPAPKSAPFPTVRQLPHPQLCLSIPLLPLRR